MSKKLAILLKEKFGFETEANLDDVVTNLDRAKKNQVVFYKLIKGREDQFHQRLKAADPGLVISNLPINIEAPFICAGDEFDQIQNLILDILFPIESIPKIIGVTGTNGKTSVCHLGMQLANQCGIKAISVGTVGVFGSFGVIPSEHKTTTPSKVEFRKIIYNSKPDLVFVEISSHALDQDRFCDFPLDSAGWTNLTQDHLDYHKTMSAYFSSKLKITKLLKSHSSLLVFDPKGELRDLLLQNSVKFITVFKEETSLKNPFFQLGFNLDNLSLALGLIKNVYPDLEMSNIDLERLQAPDGRFDFIRSENKFVIVDYAHTPDAVENILQEVRRSFSGQKIITIIGCGGDRDKKKRPKMGEISCRLSDNVIFTSDNPRGENPTDIIKDMSNGLIHKNYSIVEDRKKAIEQGINNLTNNQILLILGKGHEKYQEINGVRYEFDDKLIAQESIRKI